MFRVGDIIRGKSNNTYSMTTDKVRCEVLDIIGLDRVNREQSILVNILDGYDKGTRHTVESNKFVLEKQEGNFLKIISYKLKVNKNKKYGQNKL